jgi:NADPH:quinone reductase-like Zn-dependent oxidoreductase
MHKMLVAGALAPETIDGVLDTVGGTSFGSHVEALRRGGVLSLVGAVGGSKVSFDAYRLLEVTLTGYASDTLDGAALRRAIGFISGWLSSGETRRPGACFRWRTPQRRTRSWNSAASKDASS